MGGASPDEDYRNIGACSLVFIAFFWVSGGICKFIYAAPPRSVLITQPQECCPFGFLTLGMVVRASLYICTY
jgi:hypothetical protein